MSADILTRSKWTTCTEPPRNKAPEYLSTYIFPPVFRWSKGEDVMWVSGGGAPDSFVTQVRKQSFKIEEGGPRSANGETSFTEASTSSSFENPCNSPTTHTQTDAHTRVHTYTHGHARKQVCLDGKEPKRRKAKAGNETRRHSFRAFKWLFMVQMSHCVLRQHEF